MSDRGAEFTALNADMNFLAGNTFEDLKAVALNSKAVSARLGRSNKTATVLVMIIADTDEQAEAQVAHYRDGVDIECWQNITQVYTADADGKMAQALIEQAKRDVFYAAQPIYGSPETVAAKLTELAESSLNRQAAA